MERQQGKTRRKQRPVQSQSILSFFRVDAPACKSQEATANSNFKRKIQAETGLYLGRFTGKALATLSMSVVEGQQLLPRLPRAAKPAKRGKPDFTVRLATSEDYISNSKLAQPECEVLQPLLWNEVVQAEFRSVHSHSLLQGLQAFDVEARIHLPAAVLEAGQERSAEIRQRLTRLFALLDLEPVATENSPEISQLPEQEPPATFKSALFPFQKQALHWMLQREQGSSHELHHMWQQFNTPGGRVFYNPYTGVFSLKRPTEEPRCRGGILADEMGLGKTAVVIALIHCSKRPRQLQPKRTKLDSGGTLVVVNAACFRQWKEEFEAHSTELRVIEFHGDKRAPLSELKLSDVVLTTYGVAEASQLFKAPWFRIVFDDAHCLATKSLKTCYKLQSVQKWLVTGYPVDTDLESLFPLVKILNVLPWSDHAWWSKTLACAPALVAQLVNSIMLRRTKDSKTASGLPLVQMPPLAFHTVAVEFSVEEREVYERLHAKTRAIFDSLVCQSKFISNLTPMIELILKLRQFCDHPRLVNHDVLKPIEQIEKFIANLATSRTEYTNYLIAKIREGQEFECPVCLDLVYDSVITKCCHVFCRLCVLQQIELNKNCPLCKLLLRTSDLRSLPQCSSSLHTAPDATQTSAKVRALLELLQAQPQPTVVFSQWAAMIDLLEPALVAAGLPYQRLESYKQTVDWSLQNVLVAFKPATLGTSLTAASRVVIFDPWWNAAIEHQAIQKVHRISQQNPVAVVRLVVRDTIEERLLDLRPTQASINLESLQFILSK